jgi:alkanesulfonate monooxygenase SsuD/methylene tetrahydromethanopterin reductase-like flavin-dependent oxidoreductase (luciferase family)
MLAQVKEAALNKLSFGLSLNNRASVFLKSYPIQDLVRLAEIAEDLSFVSVWVGDSMIDSPRYEPLTLLGAVAAKTSKIKIGASIIQPHFRNPIMLALSWATLDRLSNGRTILTLGTGGGTPQGVAKEAELAGIDVKKRGKALEENVEILRSLWKGESLHHNGEVFKLDGAKIGYLPVQNLPPIWIAAGVWVPKKQKKVVSATPGYTKKQGSYSGGFERVARLADGWFTIMTSPEEFETTSRLLSELTKKYRRKPNEITRAVECWFNLDREREKARKEVAAMIEGYFNNKVDPETVERWSIYGTEKDCVNKIEAYFKAGAQVVKLIMGSQDQIGMAKQVGKTILPSFV